MMAPRSASAATVPHEVTDDAPGLDPRDAEQSIIQGLLYLEREAVEASLMDLATTIRSALDGYIRQSAQESDA